MVSHDAVRALRRKLGRRGKAVFFEQPRGHTVGLARAGAHFQLRPLVQGHAAVPHPARDPAPVAFAHPPAQRTLAEGGSIAAGQADRC